MRRLSSFLMACLLGFPAGAMATESAGIPGLERIAVGILVHDRGPTSDDNESGVDPNIELLFSPPRWSAWRSIGAPRLHLGFTPNFSGDTSVLYGGATYEYAVSPRLFATGALGLVLHDGPLHADDRVACEVDSDCGFGYRVLVRYAFEIGLRLDAVSDVTLFYDHMSHQWIAGGENEGIDHIGLRYRFRY